MKDLFDSLGIPTRAVAWTAFYVLAMWVILYFLFNFNMFSLAHWVRLTRIELHGFPGLVFGLMILAAVPLYIATTILTVRNKSMPIKIPMPHCFEPVVKQPEKVEEKPIVVEQEVLPELRSGIPMEMRENFMRAQKNYGARQMSVFNKPGGPSIVNTQPQPVPVTNVVGVDNNIVPNVSNMPDTENSAFPVPTDFDVDGGDDTNYGVPVFSDIDFGDSESEDEDTTKSEIENLNVFLAGAGYKTNKTDDDLIIGDKFAIAVHDDADFWVADDSNWFAAGKQKPSPIVALNNACKENDELHPILYLGQQNIMDADVQIEKWRADGIEVVSNHDDLMNLIKKFTE